MKFLKHMSENLFITFTGIAALVHSTWSLGTMFSGIAPSGDWWAYAAWVLPAFLVAFSMDIGQISTSAEIRNEGLTWQRGLTFFVFSIGTYYLQFLYIAHHMPVLDIGLGISVGHHPAVVMMRDAAVWILPLMLPMGTMLYTISSKRHKQPIAPTLPEPTLEVTKPESPMLEEKSSDIESLSIELIPQAKFEALCGDCGWHKEYEDSKKAERALNTHKSIHCKAKHEVEIVSQNGHVN